MSKLFLPLAVAAAILSTVFAVAQFRTASGLRARLDGVSGELDEQRKAVSRLLAATQSANDAIALLKEDNDRLKRERDLAKDRNRQLLADLDAAGKNPATAPDGKPSPNALRGIFQGFAKQMDDPEMRKMMRQGQERMVTAAYEALFKKLGLSEQESKLVAELIADRNFTALDKGRAALNGTGADDKTLAAVRSGIDAAKADSDSKLKAVLGEEKFAELAIYEQTLGDRRALDFFDRNFNSKNQPLAPEQKNALADIMREERMKFPSNEIPDLGGGPGMAVLMSDAELKTRDEREANYQQSVLSRAPAAGLNPDQVNILQDSFKQRAEWRAFGSRMGRSFIRPQ